MSKILMAAVVLAGFVGHTIAGAPGGERMTVDSVLPGKIDAFKVTFKGGELAKVVLIGSGTTDLDLYIVDADDKIVARSEGAGDTEKVEFYPLLTGEYKILVKNRGTVSNKYVLGHN